MLQQRGQLVRLVLLAAFEPTTRGAPFVTTGGLLLVVRHGDGVP